MLQSHELTYIREKNDAIVRSKILVESWQQGEVYIAIRRNSDANYLMWPHRQTEKPNGEISNRWIFE